MTPTTVADIIRLPHRPWPAPQRPWAQQQTWRDLLFAHWPLPADALRPLIPPALTLETFEGRAWLGIVPFHMTGIRFRGLPPLPFLNAFAELNVRTYVTDGHKPGVWFFSLDAASPAAVWGARRFFHLPYYNASMTVRPVGETIAYQSQRKHRGAAPATFVAGYRPVAPVMQATAGSLAAWLTERYCLYAADPRGRLYRAEIAHAPWPLQAADARFEVNSVAAACGLTLPEEAPLLHFARRLDIVAWNVVPC